MPLDIFAIHPSRTRQKWIVRSLALLIALLAAARDATPQQPQAPSQSAPRNSIAALRKRGLDIVLVIDGTGSMNLILDDIRTGMPGLMNSLHRIVPIARVGIIVFGNKREKMSIQPLTLSPQKLTTFLDSIRAMGGGEWEEDTFGACQAAIEKSDWKPDAIKMVILVGDSPPHKEDFSPLLAIVRKFKDNNGAFNTVDVAAEEHERFEREYYLKHPEKAPTFSPLPEFYRQASPAYKVMAAAGGGEMRELSRDVSVDRAIFQLVSAKLPPKVEAPPQIPGGRPEDYVLPIAQSPALAASGSHR
jgi:hypothetical protein